eukprot:scaffold56_cov379-Prasinococcus_capsulatus_cf.AAC.10
MAALGRRAVTGLLWPACAAAPGAYCRSRGAGARLFGAASAPCDALGVRLLGLSTAGDDGGSLGERGGHCVGRSGGPVRGFAAAAADDSATTGATGRLDTPLRVGELRSPAHVLKLNMLGGDASRRFAKRVGRGIGSGKGKTAGRGHKGQRARASTAASLHSASSWVHLRLCGGPWLRGRSPWADVVTGSGTPAAFEGGLPLRKRLPKRGFFNPFSKDYHEVNLSTLIRLHSMQRLDVSQPITMKTLRFVPVAERAHRMTGRGRHQQEGQGRGEDSGRRRGGPGGAPAPAGERSHAERAGGHRAARRLGEHRVLQRPRTKGLSAERGEGGRPPWSMMQGGAQAGELQRQGPGDPLRRAAATQADEQVRAGGSAARACHLGGAGGLPHPYRGLSGVRSPAPEPPPRALRTAALGALCLVTRWPPAARNGASCLTRPAYNASTIVRAQGPARPGAAGGQSYGATRRDRARRDLSGSGAAPSRALGRRCRRSAAG